MLQHQSLQVSEPPNQFQNVPARGIHQTFNTGGPCYYFICWTPNVESTVLDSPNAAIYFWVSMRNDIHWMGHCNASHQIARLFLTWRFWKSSIEFCLWCYSKTPNIDFNIRVWTPNISHGLPSIESWWLAPSEPACKSLRHLKTKHWRAVAMYNHLITWTTLGFLITNFR